MKGTKDETKRTAMKPRKFALNVNYGAISACAIDGVDSKDKINSKKVDGKKVDSKKVDSKKVDSKKVGYPLGNSPSRVRGIAKSDMSLCIVNPLITCSALLLPAVPFGVRECQLLCYPHGLHDKGVPNDLVLLLSRAQPSGEPYP